MLDTKGNCRKLSDDHKEVQHFENRQTDPGSWFKDVQKEQFPFHDWKQNLFCWYFHHTGFYLQRKGSVQTFIIKVILQH